MPNCTDAMFTLIEGDWNEVMTVIRQCSDAALASAPRVSVVVKIDIRPGHDDMLTSKVAKLESLLDE